MTQTHDSVMSIAHLDGLCAQLMSVPGDRRHWIPLQFVTHSTWLCATILKPSSAVFSDRSPLLTHLCRYQCRSPSIS